MLVPLYKLNATFEGNLFFKIYVNVNVSIKIIENANVNRHVFNRSITKVQSQP